VLDAVHASAGRRGVRRAAHRDRPGILGAQPGAEHPAVGASKGDDRAGAGAVHAGLQLREQRDVVRERLGAGRTSGLAGAAPTCTAGRKQGGHQGGHLLD